MQSPLQQAALLCAVEDLGQVLLQALKAPKGIGCFEKVKLLVREIKGGFDQRTQFVDFAGQAPKLIGPGRALAWWATPCRTG